MHRALRLLPLVVGASVVSLALPAVANAQSWEIRREIREANREVARERAEGAREIMRCKTRACAEREYREANREVARERREARREVSREIREAYRDRWYRGNDRWYRDGRYWGRDEYERRYYGRRDNGGSVLPGLLVGAAVVGVVAAIADGDDED